ncbi:hypothetical protein GCM10010392_01780 [Streptomyces clavifer]|nr:hypothetical protein GCM10010392_01780 [Streptomyces clavifer]
MYMTLEAGRGKAAQVASYGASRTGAPRPVSVPSRGRGRTPFLTGPNDGGAASARPRGWGDVHPGAGGGRA